MNGSKLLARVSRPLLALVVAAAWSVVLWSCKAQNANRAEVKDAVSAAGTTPVAGRCNTGPAAATPPAGLSIGPSCQDLVKNFPQVDDPGHPEDTRVICPFLRILKRSGLLDTEIASNLGSFWGKHAVAPVNVLKVAAVTPQLGCDGGACAFIASDVAKNQNGGWPALTVDIGLLAAAPVRATFTDQSKARASHDCGYNFKFGDMAVDDTVRQATLAKFKAIADQSNGRLTMSDLVQVKKAMCVRDYALYKAAALLPYNLVDDAHQTLVPDTHDQTEAALIYAYLGGIDNGFIIYEDLDRLFHAEFPANKSKFLLDKALLQAAQATQAGLW